MSKVSYGRVLTNLAAADPQRVAVSVEDERITRQALEQRANRLARVFLDRGVEPGRLVTLALPNGIEFITACFAAWKCGAVPNPVSPRLPPRERARILELADPALVMGFDDFADAACPHLGGDFVADSAVDDAPLPDRTSPHERAMTTGGSTGRPKLILLSIKPEYDTDRPASILAPNGCVLVPGPMYHAAPFGSATQALLAGVELVLMRRFDAARCLELIERHRVEQILFVPTMMQRISRLPPDQRAASDVSSLRVVFTGSAPCPAWLMREWIDWLGADVMHEVYGPSERIGGTLITGREWLEHPGSVGKPSLGARVRILDPETGRDLPAGEVGEIYAMPADGPGSTYRYVGAEARAAEGGWESVGDMGYLDEDGYLYLADRRTDMILVGGRNVYPAQIEAAIDAHPDVLSSAVIGLPDEDMGSRVHAIVQARNDLAEDLLVEHLREHLVPYMLPRSFELVDHPLRDDAGKVRRWELREARVAAAADGPGAPASKV